VYAWDELPGFELADKTRIFALAATVGCVAVLAELWDMAALGTRTSAMQLLVEGKRCTRTSMAALGTRSPARLLLKQGISSCCAMRTSMAAHGSRVPALRLLEEGISRCFSMRTSMAALETRSPPIWLIAEDVLRYLRELGRP
jgi:hypothetical protein